ncbi:MAG TPA: nicotinate-nucleotide adenylyltransferase [Acidobacteriaceae bacterium]|nr:nicotinate-nucleotide adenylyltransferase [Acidobacteriaceae bacterium]
MRIALFGGTFDPIHRAHLRLAEAASARFGLDRVLFVPTGRQPLKNQVAVASYLDRVKMVRLALSAQDPRFSVSLEDAPRSDGRPNYTVDTLELLAREHPGAELFAIAGADSFLTLPGWRSPARLLELAQWIVVSRPGFPLGTDFLDRPEFAATGDPAVLRSRVHVLEGIAEDISATELRRRLKERPKECPPSLPLPVFQYIQEHGLYQ